jgi:hypothetical protein
MAIAVYPLYAQTYQQNSQPHLIEVEDLSTNSREAWQDTCFGLIDKSVNQIPSGYLIDYSLAPFESSLYDGRDGDDDTLNSYVDFFSYYHILQLSAVNSNASLIPTNDLFVSARRYIRDNKKNPLLFLFQPYQKINAGALAANLFSITADSLRLQDTPGRTTSPYNNNEIFIFTAGENFISQHGNVVFSLPETFWIMPGINTVSIDFYEGLGPRNITKGAELSVNYTTEGIKYLSVSIATSNGTLNAKAAIQYRRPAFFSQPDMEWKINTTPVFTSVSNYLGAHSRQTGIMQGQDATLCTEEDVFDKINCDIEPGAEVRIINGCDRVFDKPVIIVPGFDTDGSQGIAKIKDKYTVTPFIIELRSAGYDLVFIRFTKPLDFIENNARVLEEVIERVNNTRQGTAKSAIIGFSMGGLVARWCLKDMEDSGLDHQVAQYFSYDAPHQGANIPLGLQFMFSEINRDFPYLQWNNLGGSAISPEFRNLVIAANSNASRQMMVTKAAYIDFPNNEDPTREVFDPLRAIFAEKLLKKGYPQNLTRSAIAFGRGNNPAGSKQAGNGAQFGNFMSGSKLFDGSITHLLVNVTAKAYAVPENANNDYICRFRFMGLSVFSIFGFPVGIKWDIRSRNIKYPGTFPYDDAPDGYEITQEKFVQNFNKNNDLAASASNFDHRGHNFVSTASALDLQNQDYGSANN